MNPWASPGDDAAGGPAPDLAPALDLGGTSPPPVASAALSSLDVDPWGGEAGSSVAAQPTVPEPVGAERTADSAAPLDTAPVTDPPTAVDSQLASLASASLTLHENVWGSGDTMQTAWTDEARANKPASPPAEPASPPAEPASPPAEPATAPHSEAQPESSHESPSTELCEAPSEGASDDKTPSSEALREAPAPAPGTGSTLGRLSTAVTEWRKARAAAAEKAKEAREAEQAQGWKKVAPPKPAARTRLAGWLRRGTDSTPTSPARTPTRARSLEKSAASSAGAPLDEDDLAWLEAASSRPATARSSMERTTASRAVRGVRRYDASAYDPDPRYDYDPPATYDADAAEPSASPAPPDPYNYDPDDDTDGFGEMQQYTDDGPASPHRGTYSDEPRRAPLPPPTPPPPAAASVDLLSASPPHAAPAPAPRPAPSARAPRVGALSDADMNFFETL